MRFRSTKVAKPDIDMTPMIDIVFQLIAFFMVISNFEQTQADERVKLPKNELARPPEVVRENELTLNIGFLRDDEGNNTSGPLVFYSAEDEPIPIPQIGRILKREMRLYQDQKTDLDGVTVVIRADAEIPLGIVQEVMQSAQEAKFRKFSWKATQSIRRRR